MPTSSLQTHVSLPFRDAFQDPELSFLAMDTDKIKIFGARVKVDSTGKLAELERAERVNTLTSAQLIALTNWHVRYLGKNEGESRSHRRSWHQRVHKPAADLQLPRIVIDGEGDSHDRTC